jgi:hypothetical protein
MATVLSRIFSPAPLLYTFVVVTQFAYGAYVGAQLEFPEGVTLIYAFGTAAGGAFFRFTILVSFFISRGPL